MRALVYALVGGGRDELELKRRRGFGVALLIRSPSDCARL